jgi:hypothetical protein
MLFRLEGSALMSAVESRARGGIRKLVSDGTTFVAFTGSFGEASGGRQEVFPPEILAGRLTAP